MPPGTLAMPRMEGWNGFGKRTWDQDDGARGMAWVDPPAQKKRRTLAEPAVMADEDAHRVRKRPLDEISHVDYYSKRAKLTLPGESTGMIELDHLAEKNFGSRNELAIVPFYGPKVPPQQEEMRFAICDRVMPKLIEDRKPASSNWGNPDDLKMVVYEPIVAASRLRLWDEPSSCEVEILDDDEDVQMIGN